MHKLLSVIIMVGAASPALAQSTVFDNCTTLIREGLREYNVQSESEANLNTVFDRSCSSSGEFRTETAGVGLEAVVKSIPWKFTGNYGSTKEAMTNFCRDYRAVAEKSAARNSYQETIARRGYDSFDHCITMAASGVVARHRVENIERVNFYLASGFSPVKVAGVNATNNIVCKGHNPTDPEAKEVTMNGDTRMTLVNNMTLGFVCTRTGTVDDKGTSVMQEGVVTILTDLRPNGNYTIFMPQERLVAPTEASVIMNQIKELDEKTTPQVAELKAALLSEPKSECIVLKGKQICSGSIRTTSQHWISGNRATRSVSHNYAIPFAEKPVIIDSIVASALNQPYTFSIYHKNRDDQNGFEYRLIEKSETPTSFDVLYQWLAIGIPRAP